MAKDRQVVVLTHDGRLPDAVGRLDLGNARIVEVRRAERSVVTTSSRRSWRPPAG
ncbi:hypothetical protein [Micromonospora coxensis]|uniref:hypothetical protein n=1 Tax=Micromonospora coxensis TaxID=356852 RepID=UPI003424FC4A